MTDRLSLCVCVRVLMFCEKRKMKVHAV